jgi:hypothetical protein
MMYTPNPPSTDGGLQPPAWPYQPGPQPSAAYTNQTPTDWQGNMLNGSAALAPPQYGANVVTPPAYQPAPSQNSAPANAAPQTATPQGSAGNPAAAAAGGVDYQGWPAIRPASRR